MTDNKRKKKHSKAFFLLGSACLIMLFLNGCSSEKKADNEEVVICLDSGMYFMTEDGIYLVDENNMLRYYDRQADETVLVCDKAECEHKPSSDTERATCNAQFYADEFAVYQGKIYYLAVDSYNKEKLCCRDLDGNNDRQIAVLDGRMSQSPAEAWFYQGYLMVLTSISSGETFDAETGEEKPSSVLLNCVDLETGEVAVVRETNQVIGPGFPIYKAEEGKFFYYSAEEEAFYAYEPGTGETKPVELSCSPQIYKETVQDGVPQEYQQLYGSSCYGVRGELFERTAFLRMDLETGEEEVVLEGACIDYRYYGGDYIYLVEYPSKEDHIHKTVYLYDAGDKKLTQIEHPCVQDFRSGHFSLVTKEGVIYLYAVNKKEEDFVYMGNFEYCFHCCLY